MGKVKCLNCNEENAEIYHKIFDDVGTELQLSKYLEQFFRLQVVPPTEKNLAEHQVLCDDCINQLMELIDLEECYQIQGADEENEWMTVDWELASAITNTGREISKCESPTDLVILGTSDFEATTADNAEPDMPGEECEKSVESYLDTAISSNLEKLQFDMDIDCALCGIKLPTFQDCLSHSQNEHAMQCVLCACDLVYQNAKLLSQHMIFTHCELSELQIYTICPHCDLRFSDFLSFNTHSCSHIKRPPGAQNHCAQCQITLQSFKRYAFHMQFHLAQHRPKVCLICRRSFRQPERLFEHVFYDHLKSGTFACKRCDRIWKDAHFYELHKKSHLAFRNYECVQCNKAFTHKNLYLNHMQDAEELTCKICSKNFVNRKLYLRHIRRQHVPAADVQVTSCTQCGLLGRDEDELQDLHSKADAVCKGAGSVQEIISTAYTCEYCTMDFKTSNDLREHRATNAHGHKPYSCLFCAAKFANYRNMRCHLRRHEQFENRATCFPLTRLFVCDAELCEQEFVNWHAFNYHRKRSHNPLACPDCKVQFPHEAAFEEHRSVCGTNFQCSICGKVCRTKMALGVHVARAHNSRNVLCPHCQRSYKTESVLQEHIELMHEQQQCTHCHKVMKNRRNMIAHWRTVHQREHHYHCDQCEKGFYRRNEMEKHKRTMHSGVVYRCSKCSFETLYGQSYDVHLAMHREERPFECHLCDMRFARKQVLAVHIRRHADQREFVCSEHIVDGCNASFINRYLLNKHIIDRHGKASKAKDSAPVQRGRKRKATQSAQEPCQVDTLVDVCAAEPKE